MKVKKEGEKADLKLNIQKTKIMASCLITSWQRDGETMETVTDFFSMSLVTTFLTAFGRNEPPFFSGSQAELTSLLCDFFIVNEALVSHLCRRGRLKTRFYLLQMATGR